MEDTLKLAALLIPLVFIAAVLRFVHEAMLPLLLPLVLVAIVAGVWWYLRRRSPPRD
jgi:hypothetical protein